MVTTLSRFTLTAALLVAAAGTAQGQWTVTVLAPEFSEYSIAWGATAGQQVGVAYDPNGFGTPYASLWTGTGESWINLTPPGSNESEAFDADAGQQVGWARFGDVHACLWTGTAASAVDLNPAGASGSEARAVSAGQQVGFAHFGSETHAGYWTGSAASWVSLTPPGASGSMAFGTDGNVQVGIAGPGAKACLWSGSPESFVSLHPSWVATATGVSVAYAVDSGQQVGLVIRSPYGPSAALWTGTAASYVNLQPENALQSEALDVHRGEQVGYVTLSSEFGGAAIWRGTRESCQDLSDFTPEFVATRAESIWHDDTHTYVVGWGHNTVLNRVQALLWTRVDNNTVQGQHVPVTPIDSTTNTTPATLTFSNITALGNTTLTTSTTGPAMPSGFLLEGVYYDLSTTAAYAGTIDITIDYSSSPVASDPVTEALLQLFHYENGQWKDITTSIDINANTITGRTNSLSPFAIGRLNLDGTVVEDLSQLSVAVAGLNTQFGIPNSLDAKLDRALDALTDANQNNDQAAVNALDAFINACLAQRGVNIPPPVADFLIHGAQLLIDALDE